MAVRQRHSAGKNCTGSVPIERVEQHHVQREEATGARGELQKVARGKQAQGRRGGQWDSGLMFDGRSFFFEPDGSEIFAFHAVVIWMQPFEEVVCLHALRGSIKTLKITTITKM